MKGCGRKFYKKVRQTIDIRRMGKPTGKRELVVCNGIDLCNRCKLKRKNSD